MKLFLSIGECMIEMASEGGQRYRMGFAGDTLNTAWYARAGLPAGWEVAYFTRLGTDPVSDQMRAFLSDNDISTRFIRTDPERRPGLYLIELHNGERQFSYWRDTSAARRLADDAVFLTQALAAADVVYVSGITLAILAPDRRAVLLEALTQARARGAMVAFDPNIRPRLWDSPKTLRHVTMQAAACATICLPSFEDEATWFGDATPLDCAQRYAAAGAKTVVVKNGGAEIWALTDDAPICARDLRQITPVDTTGAGDAFNGELLAALMSGAPLAEAIARAHALAGRVILYPGALIAMDHLRPAPTPNGPAHSAPVTL